MTSESIAKAPSFLVAANLVFAVPRFSLAKPPWAVQPPAATEGDGDDKHRSYDGAVAVVHVSSARKGTWHTPWPSPGETDKLRRATPGESLRICK